MKPIRWMTIGSLVLVIAACAGPKKEAGKFEEGVDVTKNPLAAAAELAKKGKDLASIQKEMENMKPVDPYPFSEIIGFLPASPTGWESGEPQGSTTQMGEWKITEVKRSYTQGESSIEVAIVDWAFHKELYAGFFMSASFSQETTEGWNKGITIGDDPGREEYEKANRTGTLTVLVGKRFLVTIRGSSIEPPVLREWWDRLDAPGLRAKAAAPAPAPVAQ